MTCEVCGKKNCRSWLSLQDICAIVDLNEKEALYHIKILKVAGLIEEKKLEGND